MKYELPFPNGFIPTNDIFLKSKGIILKDTKDKLIKFIVPKESDIMEIRNMLLDEIKIQNEKESS